MTNEIQIVSDNGGPLPVRPVEPGPASHGQQAAQQPPNVLRKIHRLLRGRYPLAIGLGVAFGVAGAVGGWLSKKPMYKSTGIVHIKSTMPDMQRGIQGPDVQIPGFYQFVKTQMMAMTSPDVIRTAMQKADWKATGRPSGEDAIGPFTKNLDVDTIAGTSDYVKIVFSDPDPRVAKAGCTDLCQAYVSYYQSQDPTGSIHKKTLIDDQRQQVSVRLATLQDQLSGVSQQYGTDNLEGYLQEQLTILSKLESDSLDAQLALNAAEQMLKEAQANGTAGQPQGGQQQPTQKPAVAVAPEVIAQGDAAMRSMLLQRQILGEKLRRLQDKYGPNSVPVQRAKEDMDLLNFQVEEYATQYNNTPHLPSAGGLQTAMLNPQTITPADVTRARATPTG